MKIRFAIIHSDLKRLPDKRSKAEMQQPGAPAGGDHLKTGPPRPPSFPEEEKKEEKEKEKQNNRHKELENAANVKNKTG